MGAAMLMMMNGTHRWLTLEEVNAGVGPIAARFCKNAHRVRRYQNRLLRTVLAAWGRAGMKKVIYTCEEGASVPDDARLAVVQSDEGVDVEPLVRMGADILPSLYRRYRAARAEWEKDRRELEFLDGLAKLVIEEWSTLLSDLKEPLEPL